MSGLKLANAPGSGPPMSSGLWYNPNGTGTTGNVAQNARAVMTPVLLPACTLNGISVDVTVIGDAASKVRFGLYADAAGLPGSLVQDFGTIAADALGANPLTISQGVSAQWYWVCSAFQLMPSVRATVRMANFNIFPARVGIATPGGSNNNVAYYFDTGMSGALPASPGAPTNVMTPSNSPAIWLKAA